MKWYNSKVFNKVMEVVVPKKNILSWEDGDSVKKYINNYSIVEVKNCLVIYEKIVWIYNMR